MMLMELSWLAIGNSSLFAVLHYELIFVFLALANFQTISDHSDICWPFHSISIHFHHCQAIFGRHFRRVRPVPRTPQGSESDVCIHALPRCRWTQANAAWTLGALEYIGNILEIYWTYIGNILEIYWKYGNLTRLNKLEDVRRNRTLVDEWSPLWIMQSCYLNENWHTPVWRKVDLSPSNRTCRKTIRPKAFVCDALCILETWVILRYFVWQGLAG